MPYMYHRVPDDMFGTKLYPLNVLRSVNRDIYRIARSKYLHDDERGLPDRTFLMAQVVPKLNCLWNDVLHSSSVHPQKIMDAWTTAGFTPRRPLTMFEIPLEMLDPDRLLIYEYRTWTIDLPEGEFIPYDPERYGHYAEVTAIAREKFKSMTARRPFWMFAHIPHVLYRGEIETRDLRTITANSGEA